jgi:hypothetical protein
MVVDQMMIIHLNLILMLIKISNDLMNWLYEDDCWINQQNVNEQMVQDEIYPLDSYKQKKIDFHLWISWFLPIGCFESGISMC